MRIGFIGLGKMGSRMVKKIVTEGDEVIVWNRSPEAAIGLQEEISKNNLGQSRYFIAKTIEDLMNNLQKPRVVWLMLPAGDATTTTLEEISKHIEQGDIVIDGGNSHYTDTEKRFADFTQKGIKFLGIGVSGGIVAADRGYPLMIGGDQTAYEYITPILTSLANPHGGFAYFGTGGAGHFVKMVHNGIEYGMMQSLGEGFGVLKNSTYNFNLADIAKLFQKGTIVSGFLNDRTAEVLTKDPTLSDIAGTIAASGEGQWTVEEGKRENVPIAVIEASLQFREKSQKDSNIQNSFAAKLVASLRNAFGGHEVQKT